MISENKRLFGFFFRAILSPKSLGMLLVTLAPVFHFRWQQYVGELTPIVYYRSVNVQEDFCLWVVEIKMSLCISAVLASSSLYVCLSPKSLWYIQVVAVSSVDRQSFSFLLAMNFLDVCLASSTKDWLFCSASELVIFTCVLCTKREGGVGVGMLTEV